MTKEKAIDKFIRSIPYSSICFDASVESFAAGFDAGLDAQRNNCVWERTQDEDGFYYRTSCQTKIQMFCIYCPKCGGKILEKL